MTHSCEADTMMHVVSWPHAAAMFVCRSGRTHVSDGRRYCMTTTFQSSPKSLWTSESVTEGQFDKICDQIADAIVDWCLARTSAARVACECSASLDAESGRISVFGVATPRPSDGAIDEIVRRVLRNAGHVDAAFGIAAGSVRIENRLASSEPDEEPAPYDDDLNAGPTEQGLVTGFACNETPEFMPAPIAIAHRLARRLAQVRASGALPWVQPDGKTLATVEYHYGRPVRV